MGHVAYLSLLDTDNSQICGGSQVYDRVGCIEIHRIDYNLKRDVDSQTGKTHSLRRHQPFSFLKPIDSATPALFHACATGKLLPTARIDLYKVNDEGCEVNYFSYQLDNVRVVSVSPMIDADSDKQDMEVISFAFEEITLAYHEGNLVVSDNWSAR